MAKLTVNDRILLHLFDYRNVMSDFPPDITQAGIAKSVGIRRSHVPRSVKTLVEQGAIAEKRERVHEAGRRLKMYFLTEKGLRRASSIRGQVGKRTILVRSGSGESELPVSEASRMYDMSFASILEKIDADNVMDLDRVSVRVETVRREFVDRQDEIRQLREWLAGNIPVLALYGHLGYGKSSLVRTFLDKVEGYRVFWMDLSEDDGTTDMLRPLVHFASRKRGSPARRLLEDGNIDGTLKALEEELRDTSSILVFDNYNIVSEDLVDAFSALTHMLAETRKAKMIIIAQEATPAYCRFYNRRMIVDGMVDEIHIKGLSQEDSKLVLGTPDIEDEAMRRIYLLTKGNPLFLCLIREGNTEELKKKSRFTNPEIQLLMFSKTVES